MGGAALRRGHPRRQAGLGRRPPAVLARRPAEYGPLKNVLGMSRIRVAYTAGAAIGPDLFKFYRSIGVNLKAALWPDRDLRLCVPAARRPDQAGFGRRAGAVCGSQAGRQREILVKGPMLLKAYYKRPDATAESLNAEGYFMTGDAGFFDEDGHLLIIDRAKDVGKAQ